MKSERKDCSLMKRNVVVNKRCQKLQYCIYERIYILYRSHISTLAHTGFIWRSLQTRVKCFLVFSSISCFLSHPHASFESLPWLHMIFSSCTFTLKSPLLPEHVQVYFFAICFSTKKRIRLHLPHAVKHFKAFVHSNAHTAMLSDDYCSWLSIDVLLFLFKRV